MALRDDNQYLSVLSDKELKEVLRKALEASNAIEED